MPDLASSTTGHSVGLWETLRERQSEIGEVERKAWDGSSFQGSPGRPEMLTSVKLPGISPMAKSLSRRKSIKTLGNIGLSELSVWYNAQPSTGGSSKAKHSVDEWHQSSEYLKTIASSRSGFADDARTLSSSNRMKGEEHLKVKQTQVQEAFQERLHDLNLYHSRLSDALSSINREISGLSADLEQTKQFMNSRFGWPITVNAKNREFRDARLGIELVDDNVEKELELERQVLESVKQENFDMLVSEAEDLLVLMKTKAGELAADIGRKSAAIKVDSRNSKMRLGEKGSGLFLPDVVRKPADSLETAEWTEVCELLLKESTEAYKDAGDLREKMKTSASLSDQLVKEHESAVNKAFAEHLVELSNARDGSGGLLKENKAAIADSTFEIDQLREKLDAQVGPLQRATTRLHDRRKRPDVERTCDIVHQSLVQEVAEIDGVCTALTGELEMAEANLAELRKVEGILEEDFAMKTKSINIDQKCARLRSFLADSADPQRVKMMQRGGTWIEWGLRWASA